MFIDKNIHYFNYYGNKNLCKKLKKTALKILSENLENPRLFEKNK